MELQENKNCGAAWCNIAFYPFPILAVIQRNKIQQGPMLVAPQSHI